MRAVYWAAWSAGKTAACWVVRMVGPTVVCWVDLLAVLTAAPKVVRWVASKAGYSVAQRAGTRAERRAAY